MEKLNNFINSNKEIGVIIVIICVMMMMILPLPPHALDFIVSFNIFVTITLLMTVLYMRSTLQLTAFPSLLLILALIRVGITISSSRLILMEGDAGDIVHTFGEFVVGGNLVIGIIIFTTITMINFIVITKGSERVAEVAARFSLDAMPGKQMSIDADVRAGSITQEVAEQLRKDLASESQLYGAMDGAMKFVKGDSIASIIDIVINICGGLIIGTLQLGMTFGSALHSYTILTVGDGMVQQIPQLLISLTAGMMITRVSNKEQHNIGQMVISQVFSNSKALVAVGILLIGFSAIPGMPTPIFLFISLTNFILAYFIKKRQANPGSSSTGSRMEDAVVEDKANKLSNTKDESFVSWKVYPIILYLSNNLRDSEHAKNIKSILANIQNDIMLDLGIGIPKIILQYQSIVDNSYSLLINEIPTTESIIYPEHILLLYNNKDYLDILDMEDSVPNTLHFGGSHLNSIWIKKTNTSLCNEVELPFLTVDEFIKDHLKFHIKANISTFLGIQETKELIDKMTEYQDLIRELLRLLPLNKISEVLQRLIAENISIRNFKVILDSLLEWAQREKDIVMITELVRKSLGRGTAFKFSKGTFMIKALILSDQLEEIIRDNIMHNNFGSFVSLDHITSSAINEGIKDLLNYIDKKITVFIVTHIDIRRYVRILLEKDFPSLHVLSYEELETHAEISCVGVVELPE